ncbi:MAG: SusC/RagA family TonB-linked outer membrane protein [Chitinophagaceae bacterium]|nr:SusC/RagA family TonB-linked outer membrane protein [Chitinophagaceae bacterium]
MPHAIMRKAAMLLVAIFGFTAMSLAQTVTGTVTDKKGEPLPGVTVSVKGTKNATSTNNQGVYTLNNAGADAVLVFTGAGISRQEVAVAGKSAVNAELETSVGNLNEVVVVGYGTARRKDLTGAVSTVQAKDFNKGTYTSADQLIQGKVAGVQMINNTGAPGGASTVKIRGNSTVTGSGQPLYVVDGVALDGRSVAPGLGDVGLGGSNPGSNPLNFINPNDIASIDVLKDASATAVYGSRAAYGVVLITTKRGQAGQPKIEFGVSAGFSKVAKKLEVLNAGQFREALKYYGLGTANDKGSSVDAFDAVTQTGIVQNYNVAISGGTDGARYRFSLGALDQTGIVKKTGIRKYTANISGNFKFLEKKNLGLDINIIPSQYINDIAPISNNAGSRGSLIGNALQWNPTEKLVLRNAANTNDSFNVKRGGDLINPVALQNAYDDKSKVTTVLASISPYIKIIKSLEYRFLYSINYATGNRRTSLQPFINFNDVLDKGRALIATNELITQQYTHTLNFNEKIASKLNLNALVGFEYIKYSNKGSSMGGYGQPNGGFGSYGLDFTNYIQYTNSTNRTISSFNDPTSEIQSYFGRAVLNYDDKYLLTATIRRDGSTKFGTNNKYGNFPSFSAAWNISKESFFKVDFINSLKLRAGWGKTGNQEFPSGAAQRRYGFSGDGSGSYGPINTANVDLKWQADKQYNIGADISILKNRVSITMDYFNKNTSDLLYPTIALQPAAPGGAPTWKNLGGNIINKGFEFAVNANIVSQKDFSWDFGVNVTFVKNNVTGIKGSINTGALDGQGISGSTVEVIRSDYPINAFFTRDFLGFDKTTGLANYTKDGDVLYYKGSPNPTKLLGISTTVSYKKLSFSANMNGAFGHMIYNNTLNNVINVGSINNGKNIALSVYQDPIKESFANPVTASSRFLEKGDYLKLANATLTYTVGNVGKIFKGVSVYVTGQNLFVITKYSGFDPEVNVDKNVNGVPSVGIEYIPYPSAKTVTFGLNVSL